jgi:hypothetical protein
MNKATRALVMTGMAAVAGATMGSAAAQAAPAKPAPIGVTVSVKALAPFRYETVGYYRSAGACFHAGRYGESRGWWNSYRCVRISAGPYRSGWALTVDRNYFGGGGHGGDWNTWNSWNDQNCNDGDWDNGRGHGWHGGHRNDKNRHNDHSGHTTGVNNDRPGHTTGVSNNSSGNDPRTNHPGGVHKS